MSRQLFNTTPDIMRIHTIVNYLRQEPIQQQSKVLDENIMISPTSYFQGKKLIPASTIAPSAEFYPLFDNYNTVILYTKNNKMINIRVNESCDFTSTSLFCHIGDPITIEVSNPSMHESVEIRFIVAKNVLAIQP